LALFLHRQRRRYFFVYYGNGRRDICGSVKNSRAEAGVQLKRENPEISPKRNRLLDIMETAVIFYHKTFLEAPVAQAARLYL